MDLYFIRRLALFVALLMWFQQTMAISVRPMISELEPIGHSTRGQLIVNNDSKSAVTLEATPWHSDMSTDGAETLTPADDDILLFPPTAIVPPGKSQVIQIQYVGDPELSVSKFYRVRVEQLPVKQANSSGGVGLAFRFDTILNVVPKQARAELSIKAIQPLDTPGMYKLEILNSGSRYATLHNSKWVIKSSNGEISLSSEQIKKSLIGNYVLPNSSRLVTFTLPEGLSLENSSLSVTSPE